MTVHADVAAVGDFVVVMVAILADADYWVVYWVVYWVGDLVVMAAGVDEALGAAVALAAAAAFVAALSPAQVVLVVKKSTVALAAVFVLAEADLAWL